MRIVLIAALVLLMFVLIISTAIFFEIQYDILRIHYEQKVLRIPHVELIRPGNYTVYKSRYLFSFEIKDVLASNTILNKSIDIPAISNGSVLLMGDYCIGYVSGYKDVPPISIEIYAGNTSIGLDEHVYRCERNECFAKFFKNITNYIPTTLRIVVKSCVPVVLKHLWIGIEHRYPKIITYTEPTYIIKGRDIEPLHYVIGVNQEKLISILRCIVLMQLATIVAVLLLIAFLLKFYARCKG